MAPDITPARLREIADDAETTPPRYRGLPLLNAASALRAAADQMEADAAEIERLKAETFALSAGLCLGHYGDEHGHPRCSLVDDAYARGFQAARALAVEIAAEMGGDNGR
jgi:hypothetical protein